MNRSAGLSAAVTLLAYLLVSPQALAQIHEGQADSGLALATLETKPLAAADETVQAAVSPGLPDDPLDAPTARMTIKQDQVLTPPQYLISPQKGIPAFNAETMVELGLAGASLAVDAMSTEKFLEFNRASLDCPTPAPCIFYKEPNPLARFFVRNRAGTGLYFASAFALDVYGTYWLRKHRHAKISRFFNLTLTAWEGLLAGHNYDSVNNSGLEFILHHCPQPGTDHFKNDLCPIGVETKNGTDR